MLGKQSDCPSIMGLLSLYSIREFCNNLSFEMWQGDGSIYYYRKPFLSDRDFKFYLYSFLDTYKEKLLFGDISNCPEEILKSSFDENRGVNN